MATFKLSFSVDNDAFADNMAFEVAGILKEASDYIMENGVPEMYKSILDPNGNRIGAYALKEG